MSVQNLFQQMRKMILGRYWEILKVFVQGQVFIQRIVLHYTIDFYSSLSFMDKIFMLAALFFGFMNSMPLMGYEIEIQGRVIFHGISHNEHFILFNGGVVLFSLFTFIITYVQRRSEIFSSRQGLSGAFAGLFETPKVSMVRVVACLAIAIVNFPILFFTDIISTSRESSITVWYFVFLGSMVIFVGVGVLGIFMPNTRARN